MRGITIILNGDSIHTGNDLNLVQEEKKIGNPSVQSYLVQVPGRNGLVNLTKGLTGRVCYDNRTLSFKYFGTGTRAELLNLREVMNKYHGENINIIDDDTPFYYYEGECTVETQLSSNYITIDITVNANPFMMANDDTILTVDLSDTVKNISIYNDGVSVTPTATVSGEATISKKGTTYNLSTGTYILTDLEVENGSNIYEVSGSGTISISYKEAKI